MMENMVLMLLEFIFRECLPHPNRWARARDCVVVVALETRYRERLRTSATMQVEYDVNHITYAASLVQ